MAEATLSNKNEASGAGNLKIVTATASALANTNTWTTGLSTVYQVFVSNYGETQAVTAAISGGTVTFTVTAGTITTAYLMAVGL